MDRYAVFITPKGKGGMIHCFPGEGFELEEMQKMVEGYIETVPVALSAAKLGEEDVDRLVMIVNEEGKLKGLKYNETATDMTMLAQDSIVGNALIMAQRGEELIGVTRETAAKICEDWGILPY